MADKLAYSSTRNRTRVGVLMDVPDMDAVMAAVETQAAVDAMEYDGVLPDTLVILVRGLTYRGAAWGSGRTDRPFKRHSRTLAQVTICLPGAP